MITYTWSLTDDQYAHMLDMIAETDVEVLGTTTARDGQPVVGLSAPLPGGKADLYVLVSTETGRIVGAEEFTTASDGTYPADTVLFYRTWETIHEGPDKQ